MVRIGDDKVVDFVEESLVEELDNIKMWQRRIQTAIEQVLKKGTLFQFTFLDIIIRLSFNRKRITPTPDS